MKNILLFSVGLSPQIVTESLYYHTQIKKRKIDSIYIISDARGKQLVLEKLLDKKTGWFYRFLEEYNLKNQINFSKKNVYGLKKIDGELIVDLKTVDENNAAVNQIFSVIEHLTDDDNRLIVCVAGGRKSMSVIVGQALQFYGREQDILTHIIVEDEIVGCPDFYYPTKNSNKIEFKGKKIDTKTVKLFLDEIPFIRLRPILGTFINKNNSSLSSLVQRAQVEIEQMTDSVSIEVMADKLLVSGKKVHLPAKNLAIYTLFLTLSKEGYSEGDGEVGYISPDNLISENILSKFLTIYKNRYSDKTSYVIEEEGRIYDTKKREQFYTLKWIQETKSKINSTLKKQLSPHEFAICQIQSIGSRNATFYGVPVKKDRIKI